VTGGVGQTMEEAGSICLKDGIALFSVNTQFLLEKFGVR
jgi:hypothetical protein